VNRITDSKLFRVFYFRTIASLDWKPHHCNLDDYTFDWLACIQKLKTFLRRKSIKELCNQRPNNPSPTLYFLFTRICTLIFNVFYNASACADYHSLIKVLVRQIESLKLYQIMIFHNNQNLIARNNYAILRGIAVTVPITVYDTQNLDCIGQNNKSIENSYLPSDSTFIIVFQENFTFQDITSAVEFYIKLSPMNTRPKVLMVLNSNIQPLIRNFTTAVLYYAWSKKFLDFTVMNVSPKNDSTAQIYTFNPFTKTYSFAHYTSEVVLFPDKLLDMNEYSLKASYGAIPPWIIKADNGSELKGMAMRVTTFITSVLNCRLQLLEENNIMSAFERVKNSKVDFVMFPLYVSKSRIHYAKVGRMFSYDSQCGITLGPISKKINISFKSFVPFLCSSVIIICLTAVFDYLTTRKDQVDILLGARLLFGQTVLNLPFMTSKRIIFASVALLSIIYSPDLTSKLLSCIVGSQEEAINTFQDVVKANLRPYVAEALIELLVNESDIYLDIVKSRSVKMTNISECSRIITKGKDSRAICFLPDKAVAYYIDKFRKSDNITSVRITGIKMFLSMEAFFFEKGSPYVGKFDYIIEKMLESGIWTKLYKFNAITDRHYEQNNWMDIDQKAHCRFSVRIESSAYAITGIAEAAATVYSWNQFSHSITAAYAYNSNYDNVGDIEYKDYQGGEFDRDTRALARASECVFDLDGASPGFYGRSYSSYSYLNCVDPVSHSLKNLLRIDQRNFHLENLKHPKFSPTPRHSAL
ncbi:hypothetical protein TSAR_015160, partial [Trichomalopsis sarcophagae]